MVSGRDSYRGYPTRNTNKGHARRCWRTMYTSRHRLAHEGAVHGPARDTDRQETQTAVITPSPSLVAPKDGQYRFTWSKHKGLTVAEADELDADFLYIVSTEFEDKITSERGLKKALIKWASKWVLPSRFSVCAGRTATDLSMSDIDDYLTMWREQGCCDISHRQLFAAIKWHLIVRDPEAPGERFQLEIGKYRGLWIDELPDDERDGYIDWMKRERIPEREEEDDLAEGIEYYHKQELGKFQRVYPRARCFRPPQVHAFRQ
ncbi:hypothetical protein BDV95DRAFT_562233 [Massariosphaeria phaeospora]|uniref:Uncharacterized protein n=1 Tax=Massariosphaeria phaeospora TaxID=100035 RepID=A0A7C8IG80_9PLEO|nr:hypothetical protein BDV95DRAFT_562233 [Massariosphaeria phaeospora]